MPRKRKIDDPIRKTAILKSIANGTPKSHAARAAGISPEQLKAYLKTDPDFEVMMDNAESMAVERYVKIIDEAAKLGTWQSAAWMLERRRPAEFGRRLEVGGDPNNPIGHEVKHYVDPSPQAVSEVVAILLASQGYDLRGDGSDPRQVREIIDVSPDQHPRIYAGGSAEAGDAGGHRGTHQASDAGAEDGSGESLHPTHAETETDVVPFTD